MMITIIVRKGALKLKTRFCQLKKITVTILAIFISTYCESMIDTNFYVYRQCDDLKCIYIKVKNGKEEEITSFFINKSDFVRKINNNLYYFYLSCGSPCGHDYYITPKETFVVDHYSEILLDEKKQCLIYGSKSDKSTFHAKIHSYNFKTGRSKVIFDFLKSKYNDAGDETLGYYEELFHSYTPFSLLFKKDAVMNDDGTLFLYSDGKENSQISLVIENACGE